MNPQLQKQITALNDQNALVAARSLMTLLELKLKTDPTATRPAGVNPTDLKQVAESGEETRQLQGALAKAGSTEAAAAARGLLILCAELGYEQEVTQSCHAAGVHVRDMGVISGPLIVAALAAVIAWVPTKNKKVIKERSTIGKDGTVTTTKEISEETSRVGADALKALNSWWARAFSG
jgi:hypothetical protein